MTRTFIRQFWEGTPVYAVSETWHEILNDIPKTKRAMFMLNTWNRHRYYPKALARHTTASKCFKIRLWRTKTPRRARQRKGNIENAQWTRDHEAAKRTQSLAEVGGKQAHADRTRLGGRQAHKVRKEQTNLHAVILYLFKRCFAVLLVLCMQRYLLQKNKHI